MQVSKTGTLLKDELLAHLVIDSLSAAFTTKQFEDFLTKCDYENKESIDIQLIVEGTEFPIDKVMVEWQTQIDKMVKECAVRLVNEKFNNIMDSFESLRLDLIKETGNKLGLEIKEE